MTRMHQGRYTTYTTEDGDGALWMNLGSLATIGLHRPKNLIHICWDNKQYESSGGEPTVATAGNIDFAGIASPKPVPVPLERVKELGGI